MKIIVPVNEDKTSVCPSFGRAPFFSITDTVNGRSEVVKTKPPLVMAARYPRGADSSGHGRGSAYSPAPW
jgi:predicted Fe-Mo cluster-binding NifX family protein